MARYWVYYCYYYFIIITDVTTQNLTRGGWIAYLLGSWQQAAGSMDITLGAYSYYRLHLAHVDI